MVVLTATLALRQLDDFDTWWHLASGRYIATHHVVPDHDVLSHTVRDHAWVNLQWGFDLAIDGLHAAGGPALLSWACAAAFTLAIVLLVPLVRPPLGDALGAIPLLAVVLAAQERFAVRPEMASFPLLVALLAILERARTGEGRGAWLLVPVMLAWVNLHALFVVGAFAIVVAIAGAPSRRLAAWGGAALLATLVNPFGLAGALFPAKLLSRIDRSNPAFATIGEFRSPFAEGVHGIAIDAYKVLLIAGTAVVVAATALAWRERRSAGASLAAAWRDLDFGGLAFFAGLAALSLAARRNAGLFAIGAAPVIARSAASLGSRLSAAARERWRRAAPALALTTTAAALGIAFVVVSGRFYRFDGQAHETGAGVIDGVFPIRAAAFAREARLPGKLYNDLAAGGYLAWDDPIGDGVFVDGRLEVYDDAFFSDYVRGMYDPAVFEAGADRFGINTVILFHHWENRRLLVERLLGTPAWLLVYADESAAIFVRAKGNDEAIARAMALQETWNGKTHDWLERPIDTWRFHPGRVDGTRAFARLLATMREDEASAEQYERLLGMGIPTAEEAEVRVLLARHYKAAGQADRARGEIDRVLQISPDNAEARAMRSP